MDHLKAQALEIKVSKRPSIYSAFSFAFFFLLVCGSMTFNFTTLKLKGMVTILCPCLYDIPIKAEYCQHEAESQHINRIYCQKGQHKTAWPHGGDGTSAGNTVSKINPSPYSKYLSLLFLYLAQQISVESKSDAWSSFTSRE